MQLRRLSSHPAHVSHQHPNAVLLYPLPFVTSDRLLLWAPGLAIAWAWVLIITTNAPATLLVGLLIATGIFIMSALALLSRPLRAHQHALRLAMRATPGEAVGHKTLVQLTDNLIFMLDAAGLIIHSSPAVARVLGVTPEQLIGQALLTIVSPENQADVRHALEAAMVYRDSPITLKTRLGYAEDNPQMSILTCRNLAHDPYSARILVTCRTIPARATTQVAPQEREALSRGE